MTFFREEKEKVKAIFRIVSLGQRICIIAIGCFYGKS